MNTSSSIDISSVIKTTTPSEVLPLIDASKTARPQKDNSNSSSSCPPTSVFEDDDTKNIGCAPRVRKYLANLGGWIGRQFLKGIINNVTDAVWDSVVKCFDSMMELDDEE